MQLHPNMCQDDKDIFKPLKLKFSQSNNAAKRPCPDNSGSTAADTTSDDNLQELGSI